MRDHQAQNSAIRDQFDRQAPLYAQLVAGGLGDQGLAWLLGAVAPAPQDKVLDVACGTGKLTLALARLAGQVTGVDLTPAMLDQARSLQAAQGVENVTFQVGDALPLPFPDAAFDVVTTRASLHHLADPAAVVGEMVRVCAPGGRVAVLDLSPAAAKADAMNAVELLRDPSHARALPPEELRALGRRPVLTEIAFETYAHAIPLAPVLDASFPEPGGRERLDELFLKDAQSGDDALGLAARMEEGKLMISYPMALVVWRKG